MAKAGEKLHLFLVLSLSAILHGYDAVLGGVHRKKKFPFTVTPLWCTESCLAEMQTWLPPVGVCHDCVVLLLNGHRDKSTVREMTPGPAVTQAIQRNERSSPEIASYLSFVMRHRVYTLTISDISIRVWLNICLSGFPMCQWAINVILYHVCKWICYEMSLSPRERRSVEGTRGWDEPAWRIMYLYEKVL